MCICHAKYYNRCSHTLNYPDTPEEDAQCRIASFTGFCFNRQTNVTNVDGLCRECEIKRLVGEIEGPKNAGSRGRASLYITSKGAGVVKKEGKKEGGRNDSLAEYFEGADFDAVKDGGGKSLEARRREDEMLQSLPYKYREAEYWTSRPGGRRRREVPAFGNWEVIERGEVEGYEELLEGPRLALVQESGDSEVVRKAIGRAWKEKEKDKTVKWMGDSIGVEIAQMGLFGRLNRPRMVGTTSGGVSWSYGQ